MWKTGAPIGSQAYASLPWGEQIEVGQMPKDTDADWREIGEAHPYFGVFTDPRYMDPTPADLADFFQSGVGDIDRLFATMQRVFGPFVPSSALDFGCGVGRLLIPLAARCGSAFGVDVADGMLREAKRWSEQAGADVELAHTIPAGRVFDWVNSLIVLQHIPPQRGYRLISELWNAVSPGGWFTLQITTFKDETHQAELMRMLRLSNSDGERVISYGLDDAPSGGMSMYDYDLGRVFALLDLPHAHAVFMEKTIHGGCHGFQIYLRKQH